MKAEDPTRKEPAVSERDEAETKARALIGYLTGSEPDSDYFNSGRCWEDVHDVAEAYCGAVQALRSERERAERLEAVLRKVSRERDFRVRCNDYIIDLVDACFPLPSPPTPDTEAP